MPEPLHDSGLRTGNAPREVARILGRARVVVFARQQIERALRRIDAGDAAAQVAGGEDLP